ncbi:hypothetical protein LUZ60_003507 [Juncus effusus]|nr:hypothetical protein LUZ60_003507 [Juncus effusus]
MEIIDNIPPPPLVPPVKQLEKGFDPDHVYWSYNITAPPTDENCILLITRNVDPYILAYYLREKKWFVKKVHMSEDDGIGHVVIVNDEIVGITYSDNFINLHLEHDKPTIEYLKKIPDRSLLGQPNCSCIIESHGELYLVMMLKLWRTEVVEKLSILKFNFSEMRWEEVKSIGDHVFFLDFRIHKGLSEKRVLINNGASESEETQLKKLPPELVCCVLNHLSYLDSRCLGDAFPKWLPIIRETPMPLSNRHRDSPCLLSFTNDYKSCFLVDPLRGMRCTIQSPELPCNVKVLSSKHGWLLLTTTYHDLMATDPYTDIFFYNPLSKAIIRLPPYNFEHKTISFSSPPTSSDCVVVAVHFGIGEMVICRKGDMRWTEIDGEFQQNDEWFKTLYTPPVFLKEKFHFLSNDGRVGIFDPVTGSWDVHGQRRIVNSKTHRHYLIESNDELFWLWATEDGDRLIVCKLDQSNYVWKETTSLEGMCFFVCRNSSISDGVLNLSKNKEERIYFPMLQDGQFVHYSCIQDRMFPKENFDGAGELSDGSCWIQPCWVQHTDEELRWF